MKTFETIQTELRTGVTTCERLTKEYLDAIEAGRGLNAFLSVFPEKALA
jgi:Asp-tRNA(Asn)/Glu-tRNA(Gln) amidotransferase A subunit family amidase